MEKPRYCHHRSAARHLTPCSAKYSHSSKFPSLTLLLAQLTLIWLRKVVLPNRAARKPTLNNNCCTFTNEVTKCFRYRSIFSHKR